MSKSDEQLLQEQAKRYEIEFELQKFIVTLKEKHNLSNHQVSAVLCKQAWELLR